ncbi:MAG: CinA family nicotinamide mononucleotide deamidase-related protein [Chitinophagaceae bacterium]|nr:MAG: CinA family nicotinamide mononucleotide deamidase-related protein [Chitinophagaceae bacterium]
MAQINASIITIGDELLIGQVIDTNSAFIAQSLNHIGIVVKSRVAVGDDKEAIENALTKAISENQIVILTGGLGPTADDITKPLLNAFFNGKMVMHDPTLKHIEYIFEKVHKRPMIDRNRKQAEVPDTCEVLFNETGTAPGMLFKKDGCLIFSLPGVPHEMKWLTENKVIPLLKTSFVSHFVQHRTLLTAGIGESFLAELILDFENAIPSFIKLAYLPNYGMVRLRLTGTGSDGVALDKILDEQFELLKIKVADYLVTDQDDTMEVVVGKLLKAKHQTVASAESCTGGYIGHLLSKHAGSSTFYTGGIISYDNRIKTEFLDVPTSILQTVGAVSKEAVEQMAIAVREKMNTDYAISVSGIMGPTGNTDEKPLGMVWVGVANKEKVVSKVFYLRFDRQRNIEITATQAINLLRLLIINKI